MTERNAEYVRVLEKVREAFSMMPCLYAAVPATVDEVRQEVDEALDCFWLDLETALAHNDRYSTTGAHPSTAGQSSSTPGEDRRGDPGVDTHIDSSGAGAIVDRLATGGGQTAQSVENPRKQLASNSPAHIDSSGGEK